MDLGFGGKVAVITGGAGGMGEGCARTLVGEGAKVVIADVLDERGMALATELGNDNARYVHTDVTDYRQVRHMVDEALSAFGTIDILINTAGILQMGSLGSIDDEVAAWDRMFAVHVRGTWLCIKEVTERAMIPKQYGKIVNIASLCNHSGQGGMSSYCTAKAAISQLTQGGARALGRQGINMNCVSPGNVRSPMTEKVFFDRPDNPAWKRMKDEVVFGYIGEAMDVVPAIVFLCSDKAKWIVGADLNVSAGQVIY
jgi:3alpha(or 20beta)-hydroxysteroid dehydrogenase